MSFLFGACSTTTQYHTIAAVGNAAAFIVPEVNEEMSSFSSLEPVWAGLDSAAANLRVNGLLMQVAPGNVGAGQNNDPAFSKFLTTDASSAAERGIFHLSGAMHPTLTDLAVVVGIVVLWESLKWFMFKRGAVSKDKSIKSVIDEHAKGLSDTEVRFLRAYTAAPSALVVVSDSWYPSEYAKKVGNMLDAFLASTPELSDDFFKVCQKLVELYAERRPRPDEHLRNPWVEAPFEQIAQLIGTERILADKRFRWALEAAAKISDDPPVKDDLFTEGYGSGMKLKQGVTVGLIREVGRFAFSSSLWEGKFGKIFFTSLANAVKILSRDYPEEAQKAREILLHDCWRNQYARDRIECALRDVPLPPETEPATVREGKDENAAQTKHVTNAVKGNGGRPSTRSLD